MSWNKKHFPTLEKKIKWFLSSESWKISKKDALWLAAWSALLSWISQADAASSVYTCNAAWTFTCSVEPAHGSWLVNWHMSSYPWATFWHGSHGSHASHGSHGSHGSCCGWAW